MKPVFNIEWKDLFVRLYEKSDKADIFSRSAQVAFYLSFSLFPFLFFLTSLFGVVLESADGLKNEVFAYLNQIMPGSAFRLVRNTLEEIVANSSGGKLTLGLVITLWSASAGVDGIRGALNAIYELKERRSWWLNKIESLALTVVVSVLVSAVLTIVFYGWQLVQMAAAAMGLQVTSPFVLIGIQWISIVLLMLVVCEVIFNLLPDFRKIKWIWITPGSIVAIVLWLILTSGFRLYLASFNSYDRAYGSLGAVMVLMLWLYLTAMVVMIGGVINAVVAHTGDQDDESIQ